MRKTTLSFRQSIRPAYATAPVLTQAIVGLILIAILNAFAASASWAAPGEAATFELEQLLGKWAMYEWKDRADSSVVPHAHLILRKNMTGEFVADGISSRITSFSYFPSKNPAWLDLTFHPTEGPNAGKEVVFRGLVKTIDLNTLRYEFVIVTDGQTSSHPVCFVNDPKVAQSSLLRRVDAKGKVVSSKSVNDPGGAFGIGAWDVTSWGASDERNTRDRRSSRRLEISEDGYFSMSGFDISEGGFGFAAAGGGVQSGSVTINCMSSPIWIDFELNSGRRIPGLIEDYDGRSMRLEIFPAWYADGHPTRFSDNPGSNTVILDLADMSSSPIVETTQLAKVPISFSSVLGNLPPEAFSGKPIETDRVPVVVLPVYDTVTNGLVYGYFDTTGGIAVEPRFEQAWSFFDRMAVVVKDGKYGYIDRAGRYVVTPTYDKAWRFYEGMGGVMIDSMLAFVDTTGVLIVPPIVRWNVANGSYSESLACVVKDGKYGYLDKSGQFAIAPVYDSAGEFHDRRARVYQDGRWGFIDKAGKMVIENRYYNCRDFSDGLAAVMVSDKSPGKWEFIDTAGNAVIPGGMLGMTRDAISSFSGGRAMVQIPSEHKEKTAVWAAIDTMGNILTGTLAQLSAAGISEMHGFSEGRATFCLSATPSGGGCGFHDSRGQMTFVSTSTNLPKHVDGPITAVASEIKDFHEGLAAVKAGGKWGFVDTTGAFVIPPVFDRVGQFGTPHAGSVWLELNGRYALLFRGRLIFDGSKSKWDSKRRTMVSE